jgi:hypothetical protein
MHVCSTVRCMMQHNPKTTVVDELPPLPPNEINTQLVAAAQVENCSVHCNATTWCRVVVLACICGAAL